MAVLMMLTVAYFAHKNGWGADIKFKWPTRLQGAGRDRRGGGLAAGDVGAGHRKLGYSAQVTVFVGLLVLFAADKFFNFQAVLPIMTPVLLIGGMTTGVFTPTEGAIAACVWAMVLGLRLVPDPVTAKMFVEGLPGHGRNHGHGAVHRGRGASIFGWMLTATGVTTAIADWVLGFTKEPWVFLLLANLLMLFVGCFLEPTAAITILVPILVPIVPEAGHRPGALRPGDGAEPDDRPAAPAAWAWCCSCWRGWPSCRWSAPPWPSCPGWFPCWAAGRSSPTFPAWRCGCRNSFIDP